MVNQSVKIIGLVLGVCLLGPYLTEATPAPKAVLEKKAAAEAGEASWDFQKDNLNSVPGFGKAVAGNWQVLSEPDHPGNKVLAQLDSGKKMSVYLSKSNYVNFEISLRLRTDMFERQSHNWQMGLIFRNRDSRHFYKLRVSAANAALLLVAPPRNPGSPTGTDRANKAAPLTSTAKNGGEQLLFFLPLGSAKDQWQRLGIKAHGEYISVLLNGREVQTLSDGGVGSGQVGFYTYNTVGYFDDVAIKSARMPKFSRGLTVDHDPFVLPAAQA
ncbi:MAG: hypothetical protein HGA76_06505, partial [Candidatus Firestonebacteria bacterium]|nr:hypothetical protein [Candidatus Firestonebacteria bacterium]